MKQSSVGKADVTWVVLPQQALKIGTTLCFRTTSWTRQNPRALRYNTSAMKNAAPHASNWPPAKQSNSLAFIDYWSIAV